MRQNDKENLIECAKRHKQGMDITKSQFGSNFPDEFTEKSTDHKAELDTKHQAQMKNEAFEKWSAHLPIKNGDQQKCGKFTAMLQSQFNLRKNLYPATRTDAIEALNDHPHDNCKSKKERREDQQSQKSLNEESTESSFAQFGEGRCFVCGNKKHTSPNCPHRQTKPKNEWWMNKQVQNFTNNDNNDNQSVEIINNQLAIRDNDNQNEVSQAHWSNCMNQANFSQFNLTQNELKQEDLQKVIPLDTASTVDLACNPKPGNQVENAKFKMKSNTNAGNKIVTKKIDTPSCDKVWFDEKAITNTFAFYNLAKKHHITHDNHQEDAFLIHMKNGIKKFIPTNNGLHHHRPQNLNPNCKSSQDSDMIQTVKENKRSHSEQDQKRATRA